MELEGPVRRIKSWSQSKPETELGQTERRCEEEISKSVVVHFDLLQFLAQFPVDNLAYSVMPSRSFCANLHYYHNYYLVNFPKESLHRNMILLPR